MTAASRRGMLGGVAALLPALAGAAMLPAARSAEAASDTELAAIGREAALLIREWERLTVAWFAIPPGNCHGAEVNRVVDLLEPIDVRLDAMAARAFSLPARTPEELRAKAMLLKRQMRITYQVGKGLDLSWDGEMAWSLITDLLGGAA